MGTGSYRTMVTITADRNLMLVIMVVAAQAMHRQMRQ